MTSFGANALRIVSVVTGAMLLQACVVYDHGPRHQGYSGYYDGKSYGAKPYGAKASEPKRDAYKTQRNHDGGYRDSGKRDAYKARHDGDDRRYSSRDAYEPRRDHDGDYRDYSGRDGYKARRDHDGFDRDYRRRDTSDSYRHNDYGRHGGYQVCDSDGDRCYGSSAPYWNYREYYRRHGYRWEND